MEKFLPQRASIDAFGNGGFRFAGMSHIGSLLVLPSGMRAWEVKAFEALRPEDLAQVLQEKADIDFLLIGTGSQMLRLPQESNALLSNQGFLFDCMSTSSAIHDYNVMFAESRRVAAALIAVDHAHGR